eukprot:6185132-Pleurochrysis_carterae.AAC.2
MESSRSFRSNALQKEGYGIALACQRATRKLARKETREMSASQGCADRTTGHEGRRRRDWTRKRLQPALERGRSGEARARVGGKELRVVGAGEGMRIAAAYCVTRQHIHCQHSGLASSAAPALRFARPDIRKTRVYGPRQEAE